MLCGFSVVVVFLLLLLWLLLLLLLLSYLLAGNLGLHGLRLVVCPSQMFTPTPPTDVPLVPHSFCLSTGTQGHGVQGVEDAGAGCHLPRQLRPRWPHGGLGQHLHGELGSPSRRQLPGPSRPGPCLFPIRPFSVILSRSVSASEARKPDFISSFFVCAWAFGFLTVPCCRYFRC